MNGRQLNWILLSLNIVLAGYILWGGKKAENTEQRRFVSPPKTTHSPARIVTNLVVRTNAFRWAQLESEDYREYIERLRSIGCPEETIQDIVIADLDKLIAARLQEINGPRQPGQYWKAEQKELVRTIDTLQKLQKKTGVDFEKREIVRDLLGIDLAAQRLKQQGEHDLYEERLSFLPEEKRSRVRDILEKANREEVFLREKSWLESDSLTKDDREALRQLEQQKAQSVAALLTPEELERFELWFSPSAYRVRDAFFDMNNSEEEFLSVYSAQKQFDETWAHIDPSELSGAEKQRYDQDRTAYDAAIAQALGADRHREFNRAQDPDYRQLMIAAVQHQVDAEAAREAYEIKQLTLEHRKAVLSNSGWSDAQKSAILEASALEAEKVLVELIGPKAFRQYVRAGAGRWIWE